MLYVMLVPFVLLDELFLVSGEQWLRRFGRTYQVHPTRILGFPSCGLYVFNMIAWYWLLIFAG